MTPRRALAALVLVVATTSSALARPTYFATLRAFFSIPAESRIDACGVCHKLWTGTGARNDFGTAVEQQLYTGKSIVDSLHAIETLDSDGDGFLNVDELVAYLTLPGYDCDTFDQAIDAPLDYHTYITPFVDTCLPPLDIRPSLGSVSFLTQTGRDEVQEVTILNYGATTPLHIERYGFAAGVPETLTLTGPTPPLDLPPGESITLAVTFAPTATSLVSTTVDIVSNDPETPTLAILVSGIGFVKNLAPAADRAACRDAIDRAYRKYSRTVLDAWTRCATDESRGVICRRGKRDQTIARAEDKLRRSVGGDRDKACAGASISPVRLDYPLVCGGGCNAIGVTGISALTECLVCRHDEVVDRALLALVGTPPPDLPATTAASEGAAKCITQTAKAFTRATDQAHQTLGACELPNVTAESPIDCAAASTDDLAAAAAEVDDTFAACATTDGLTACPLFGEEPDPSCLGSEATALGIELAHIAYDTPE
jgi:hypothetical protein